MFGFKKNEKPTLIIEAKDLMEIIKSDYDNDMAFTLIEFSYNEKKYDYRLLGKQAVAVG